MPEIRASTLKRVTFLVVCLWPCPRAFGKFVVVLTLTALAACAQPSAIANKSELLAVGRQASLEDHPHSSFVSKRPVAVSAAKTKGASYGIASFYAEDT